MSDKPASKGKQTIIQGVQFTFLNADRKPATGKPIAIYKPNDSETAEIAKKLLGSLNKTIRTRLVFAGSEVTLFNPGSADGGWVWVKDSGPLKKDASHRLKDGDQVSFGAKAKEGETLPETIRVEVKLLTDPPVVKKAKAPGPIDKAKSDGPNQRKRTASLDSTAKPASIAPSTSSTKVTKAKAPPKSPVSATLKPPSQHKRASSLIGAEKPASLAPSFKSSASTTKPTVELQDHTEIPWSTAFRLGYGIDALTGEFKSALALQDVKLRTTKQPQTTTISVQRLQWKDVVEVRDEFEVTAGATVNAPVSVGASSKIASVLAENATTSTMLIQYKEEGKFLPQYIDGDAQLKKGFEKIADDEFRAQYGDYYIVGMQREYSCRMIVVCKVDEGVVTETHEKEAMALVGDYFKAGVKLADLDKRSKGFTVQNVLVDAEGCTVDSSVVFSVGMSEAPKTLARLLKNAPGTPRTAYLYHYSSIRACKLSRRVEIHKDMFDKANAMRSIYAYLERCLLHPALQPFAFESRKIRAVRQRFKEQRAAIVHLVSDDKRTAKDIKELEKELKQWKEKADALITRYNFISAVTRMDKGIVEHPPVPVDGQLFYRWDCGKTGALKKLSELKAYNLIQFENNYKAFELEWQTPMTDKPSLWHKILKDEVPRQTLSFTAQAAANALPPSPFSSSPKPKLHKPRPENLAPPEDAGTFAYLLTNHKQIMVLGCRRSDFSKCARTSSLYPPSSRASRRSPSSSLPAEVTSEIFIHCLPGTETPSGALEAPLLLCFVCKTWANIARATPALWRSFVIDPAYWHGAKLAMAMQLWASAAGALPLDVTILGSLANVDLPEFVGAFREHLAGSITSLGLRLHTDDLLRLKAHPLNTPKLRELEVIVEDPDDANPAEVNGLFGEMPLLRTVALEYLRPSAITLPWDHIIDFRCETYTFAQLLEALRLLPNLLRGDFKVEAAEDEEILDTTRVKVTIPAMRNLSLEEYPAGVDSQQPGIIEVLTLPALESFQINMISDDTLEALLQRSQYPQLKSLDFSPPCDAKSLTKSFPLLDQLTALHIRHPSLQFVDYFFKQFGAQVAFLPRLEDLRVRCIETAGDSAPLAYVVYRATPAVTQRHARGKDGQVAVLKAVELVTGARPWVTHTIEEEVLGQYRRLQADGVRVQIGDTRRNALG
ncbi:F-box domain-containing protein [Mycena kentingensis (nom. inval.)]|nr:F-box domain-containing protein [Mycena kentingensis (nom. inval.)]